MFEAIRDQCVAHIVDKEILDLDGIDDPGHVAVFEYWDRVRRARVGPPVGEFRLEALPPAIIPSTAVIDFLRRWISATAFSEPTWSRLPARN